MRNLPAVLIGVAGIGTSFFLWMLYKKDKEIEKKCGCKKSPQVTGGNKRVADIQVNGMNAVGGGIGGGRSASDVEKVMPRGISVTTQAGSSTDAIYGNRVQAAPMNRRNEFDSKVSGTGMLRSQPTVSGNFGRVIQNREATQVYYTG